jgi:uncharacterized tellurite resistance protein B-like protein
MQGEELISLLVHISKSDNHFDDFELSYILQVGQAVGLNQYQIEETIRAEDTLDPTFPKTEQERMNILYYMLFLMKIDQNVSHKEKELIHHYGFKLGFSKAMLDEFVHLISKHQNSNVPTNQMLSIIKKYQN